MRLGIGIAVGATLLALAAPAGAQRPAAAGDGIKLHGAWTIVVRSAAGGRVVSRHHFENALTSDGAKALIRLLARASTMGRWAVELNGSSPSTAHPCNNSGVQFCWVSTEADVTFNGFIGPVTKSLHVTSDQTTPQLTLQGNVVVDADATIGQVVAGIQLCAATSLSADCKGAGLTLFSLRGLSPGIPVTNGQQVAITVHYTFT